jgi:hypothetical protein
MRNNNLTKMFPDAKGCNTKAGAERRVAKVAAALEENSVTHVVIQREDGVYLPVAIVNDRNSWMTIGLINAGFCVTN